MSKQPKIEVRDLRGESWVWAHKCVLFSPHVSASDFRVYCALASYADNRDQNAWPSIATIAARIHMGRSTVQRSIVNLKQASLVSVEHREGTSSIYTLLDVKNEEEITDTKLKKRKSAHREIIEFFYETAQKARGFKPTFNARDTAHLKRILDSGMLSQQEIEQMIVYYLYAPDLQKFTPSLATLFSHGITNSIVNTMKNDPEFWKRLDSYFVRMNQQRQPIDERKVEKNMNTMADLMARYKNIKSPLQNKETSNV